MEKDRYEQHWTLDKRINVSHLLATLTFIVGGIFAFTQLQQDVAVFSNRLEIVEHRIQVTEDLSERVIKLEVILSRLDSTLTRLEQKLDGQEKK